VELTFIDVITFVGFIAVVVAVSLYASRREKTTEDYFLAGRRLTWGLIGFSLIASNISTEHFVGMAGQAFGRVGLAIASYEWIAALSLVIVAWWLLPKFLRAGIYTMPEFLEYRYDRGTRTIMATYLMALYVVALLATVLYSAAQGLNGVFGFPELIAERFDMDPARAHTLATLGGIWAVGIIAATYTVYGGLRAVVWSDLLQGGALVFGGVLVLYLGLKLTGGGTLAEGGGVTGGSIWEGWRTFRTTEADKLHTCLPWNDPDLPWLAVFVGGLWIPNLFYWGLNQFITQRTLGARSLAAGQKGIFLACAIKLIIPFIIVMPGIMAYEHFGDEILALAGGDVSKAGEQAYPYLITQLMPGFLRGVMLAALAGAVMSTFNSGINSASTIFTIDIYSKYVKPDATPRDQVYVGRWATAVIALIACLLAPLPGKFEGVFNYIQEIWGFISPAILAAFFFGLLVRTAPAAAGRAALLVGPLLYGMIRVPLWIMKSLGYSVESASRDVIRTITEPTGERVEMITGATATLFRFLNWTFLHHMMLVFVLLIGIMTAITLIRPRRTPITYPTSNIDTTVPKSSYVYGSLIILATIALYAMFW
jgi:SSS family solute:Na+ symporter